MLSGWIPDTPHVAHLLEAVLSSGAVPRPQKSVLSHANVARFHCESMDEAIRAYRRAPSPGGLRKVNEILCRERPLLPLLYGADILVSSSKIRNQPKTLRLRPYLTELTLDGYTRHPYDSAP